MITFKTRRKFWIKTGTGSTQILFATCALSLNPAIRALYERECARHAA